MWCNNAVQMHGDGVKHMKLPLLGPISFEYSAFAVDLYLYHRWNICLCNYSVPQRRGPPQMEFKRSLNAALKEASCRSARSMLL